MVIADRDHENAVKGGRRVEERVWCPIHRREVAVVFSVKGRLWLRML